MTEASVEGTEPDAFRFLLFRISSFTEDDGVVAPPNEDDEVAPAAWLLSLVPIKIIFDNENNVQACTMRQVVLLFIIV